MLARVLHDCRESFLDYGGELNEQAVSRYEKWLATATPQEIFTRYCEWNGIIGYASDLWSAVEALQKRGRE